MTERPEVLAALADRIATELGMSVDRAWEMPMQWYMMQTPSKTYEAGSALRKAVISICHANDITEGDFHEVAPLLITGERVTDSSEMWFWGISIVIAVLLTIAWVVAYVDGPL